jgi:PTS system nitrogen regulatory IIA component
MTPETYSLEDLAAYLGRDRRELERLASRGRLPGRKVGGDWVFHSHAIAEWLEREMRGYSDSELANVEQTQRSGEIDSAVPVTSLLTVQQIAVPLEARTRRSVLEQLVELAGATWKIWEPATVLKAVQEREELHSTAFDNGVAIPHTREPLPHVLEDSVLAFGRSFSGIPFGAANNSPTDLFFLLVCKSTRTHLHVLARLGRMFQRPGFLSDLRQAEDAAAAYQVIAAADEAIN